MEEVVHLIADRHAHNQADVSLHRAVSIRGCPVSREGPSAPCEETPEGEAPCRSNSICQLDCHNKEFCRDVEEEAGAVTSIARSVPDRSQLVVGMQNSAAKNLQVNSECYGTFRFPESDPHADHEHHSTTERRTSQCSKNYVYGSQKYFYFLM